MDSGCRYLDDVTAESLEVSEKNRSLLWKFVMGAKDYIGSLFLKELFKGMALTGRYMFARKITVQFPE